MNNLIGITGQKGSGKDTVAIILAMLYHNYEDHVILKTIEDNLAVYSDYKIKKFAQPIKEFVANILGVDVAMMEDREFKEKELGEEWWRYKLHDGSVFRYISKKHYDSLPKKVKESNSTMIFKLTPRLILQLLGTEVCRQIHPNFWVNSLFSDFTLKKEKIKYEKVNYLPTRYDRMDEYYQLDSNVSKEDFLLFMKPIIGYCTSFKDFSPSKLSIDRITNRREESLYDIVGGFFGKMGYYKQDFYNKWLPKDLQSCLITNKNLAERRFNWVLEELKNYPDYKKESFPKWIISDCRFNNEAEAIKSRGGIIIKVERDIDSQDSHASEKGIDQKYVDLVIDNNGTIENLVTEVKNKVL